MVATLIVDEAFTKARQWGPSQKTYFFIIQLARICVTFHCFASSCLDYELNWTCVNSVRHPPSFRHLDSSVNLTLVEKHRTKVCEAYESGLCSLQFDGSVTSTATEVTCSSGTAHVLDPARALT